MEETTKTENNVTEQPKVVETVEVKNIEVDKKDGIKVEIDKIPKPLVNDKGERIIRILAYCDSPSVSTGFGSVAKGIFKNLALTNRYDIDIYGINDRGGWKDPQEHPYRIYMTMLPGEGDVYGRLRLIDAIRGADLDIRPPWDIIFTLNDPFIFEQPLTVEGHGFMKVLRNLYDIYRKKTAPDKWFKIVSYWPVDSYIKENWVENAVAHANHSVAYTNYGRREIEKSNKKCARPAELDLTVIYHGTNTSVFYPLTDQEIKTFKEKFFKNMIRPSTFIVTCVARNQQRKDIPRVMRVFREFQKRRPDSFLYIHANPQDAGGSLMEYARAFNLEQGKDWTFPNFFNPNIGYPEEALNFVYNMSDVVITASVGEGWGLPITEAMATKTLSIGPNHTSIAEIFNTEGDDFEDLKRLEENTIIRGIPVKTASTSSEWASYGPSDLERIRPLMNVDDAVKKLLWVYENQAKAAEIAERGYNWVQQYSWEKIAQTWDAYFKKVVEELDKEREVGWQELKQKEKEAVNQEVKNNNPV